LRFGEIKKQFLRNFAGDAEDLRVKERGKCCIKI
tara:strand:- start:111 stop:212 length:102 start_codon:yes stop_codon:yes gene_type:complete